MSDPKMDQAIAKIIKRCWDDSKYQTRFMSEPHAVLKEEGVDVPQGLTLKVVQNTENVHYLAIPPKPTDQLSDRDLEGVAGGAGTFQLKSNFLKNIKLTGVGGGTHDPGRYCIPNPC
jgi:hypothetical protein